jgi:hypothetical protein
MSATQEELAPETVRALTAYYRSNPATRVTPATSGPETHGGLRYVVLRHGTTLLAVYRLRNDGVLKRVKRRWPATVT